jgi:hypothetical protein
MFTPPTNYYQELTAKLLQTPTNPDQVFIGLSVYQNPNVEFVSAAHARNTLTSELKQDFGAECIGCNIDTKNTAVTHYLFKIHRGIIPKFTNAKDDGDFLRTLNDRYYKVVYLPQMLADNSYVNNFSVATYLHCFPCIHKDAFYDVTLFSITDKNELDFYDKQQNWRLLFPDSK